MIPSHERRVRFSEGMFEQLFIRDKWCNRIRITWGEPDDEGFYTPTLHTDATDNPLTALRGSLQEALDESDPYPRD